MATRIFVFNALDKKETSKAEIEIEGLYTQGWEIVSAIGGNQGMKPPNANEGAAIFGAPTNYIVLIFRRDDGIPL